MKRRSHGFLLSGACIVPINSASLSSPLSAGHKAEKLGGRSLSLGEAKIPPPILTLASIKPTASPSSPILSKFKTATARAVICTSPQKHLSRHRRGSSNQYTHDAILAEKRWRSRPLHISSKAKPSGQKNRASLEILFGGPFSFIQPKNTTSKHDAASKKWCLHRERSRRQRRRLDGLKRHERNHFAYTACAS